MLEGRCLCGSARWQYRGMPSRLHLTEPGPRAHISIRHFDGLETWEDLPQDGRCVGDMWF